MEAMTELNINSIRIPFELRRSKRARRLRLQIESQEPKVVLVAPRFAMRFEIDRFLLRQTAWIEKHWLQLQEKRKQKPVLNFSVDYYKAKAERLIHQKLEHYSRLYGFTYNRVTIRSQKSRWGSCSSKKNLNFNWRLALAPDEILDYVVVHELCHTKYMNHSPTYWKLVNEIVPDHKARRKWLKENDYLLRF